MLCAARAAGSTMGMAYPAVDLYGGRSAGTAGWGWAFSVLGAGGVLGLGCMLWLRRLPEARRLAGGKR